MQPMEVFVPLGKGSTDIAALEKQNKRVQQILLDLVQGRLALVCLFYLCVFLQELE